jgi:hypothetical protein
MEIHSCPTRPVADVKILLSLSRCAELDALRSKSNSSGWDLRLESLFQDLFVDHDVRIACSLKCPLFHFFLTFCSLPSFIGDICLTSVSREGQGHLFFFALSFSLFFFLSLLSLSPTLFFSSLAFSFCLKTSTTNGTGNK